MFDGLLGHIWNILNISLLNKIVKFYKILIGLFLYSESEIYKSVTIFIRISNKMCICYCCYFKFCTLIFQVLFFSMILLKLGDNNLFFVIFMINIYIL